MKATTAMKTKRRNVVVNLAKKKTKPQQKQQRPEVVDLEEKKTKPKKKLQWPDDVDVDIDQTTQPKKKRQTGGDKAGSSVGDVDDAASKTEVEELLAVELSRTDQNAHTKALSKGDVPVEENCI